MDPKQRLADLEKTLDVEYKRLGFFQLKISEGVSADQEFYYTHQINNYIMPRIRKYEEEKYWWRLAAEARSCEVAEADASQAIVKVVQEVELIQSQPNKYPNELMDKLQEIFDKLNEPQTPAAAKLKAALPLIPGILFYEVELDTEISLTRVFDRIKKVLKKAIEDEKKK